MSQRYECIHRDSIRWAPEGGDWVVRDTVDNKPVSVHKSEVAAEQHATDLNNSRYLRQRNVAKRHPNRKDPLATHHDPDKTPEVQRNITDAIAEFKKKYQ